MAVSRVVRILQDGEPESRVTARGWVRTRRDSRNGFSFIELNDGSCLKNLQVVVDAGIDGYEESIRQVTTGASVSVDGVLKDSPGKGQRVELHAESLRVIGTADPATYPLQKKGHTMEFLREIAHLRPRTNTFGAVARVRNQICWSIHSFFQERGFLYLNCPVITTFKGKGLVSDHHPLGCGVLGRSGTPIASWFMNEADCLLVLGASFSNHTGITPKKPTIQVDYDPMVLGKFH
ncbi:MAG: OB-fold nucleic acid binding domain-containing protein, partial [Planctomycetaceae bacterium]